MPHICSCCDTVEVETMVMKSNRGRDKLVPLDAEEGLITSVDVKNDTDKKSQEEPKNKGLDMNNYATKKSAAQSMLDVALLIANLSQLKSLLYVGPQYRFYIPLLVLLSLSITLQVIVGLLLVFIATSNLNDEEKHKKLNMMNNAVTLCVFFTVLFNIFITAFGLQGYILSSFVATKEPQLPFLPGDNNTTGLTLCGPK